MAAYSLRIRALQIAPNVPALPSETLRRSTSGLCHSEVSKPPGVRVGVCSL